MTERLYYNDSYLTTFRARVADSEGLRVYLDRTAFYPTSGGQPHDTGELAGSRVIDVVDEGDRVAHVVTSPVAAGEVECRIDWPRRFDHMQQHSGQHLLSAVLVDLFGASTVGFHMGADVSTIDVAVASLSPDQIAAAEARANELVFENRPMGISYGDSSEDLGLRKASEREGTLRIIEIENLDRSACGGTHVRATGEIGPVLIRKLDKAHGNLRIEFLCGMRAIRRARADFDALSQIAKTLSLGIDEAPAIVAAQFEAAQSAEKGRRRLATELARYRGRELYESAVPDAAGVRRHTHRIAKGALDEEIRALAQSFTAQPRAVFTAIVEDPPAILFSVSKDTGIQAGEAIKAALAKVGGRGGGSAQMAQAGAPSKEALKEIAAALDAIQPA